MINYFYPREKGERICGQVIDHYVKDRYGNELIVLDTKLKDADSGLYALPAHASLKYQCEDVWYDDYLEITYKGKKLSENGWEMHDYDVDHFKKGCIGWYMRMGDALDLDRSEIAEIIEYEIESMKY